MDSKKSIQRSVAHFFSGTLLSRISGMIRDMGMAYAFGAGGQVAAFFVALRFAHLFRRLLGDGALAAAFIPHFEELRADHPKKACQFFSDLYIALGLSLLSIIGTSLGLIYWMINYLTLSSGVQQILVLTAVMLPSLLFICLYALNGALLQCEKRYFLPSVAPVGYNALWISGALIISIKGLSPPMIWLSGIIVIACLTQWLVTLPSTVKILLSHGVRLGSFSRCPDQLKVLVRPLLLGLTGVGASQINSALDTVFARYAEVEGPALLWYAIRIQQVPLALFGIALSSALLPPLSRAIKACDFNAYRRFLQHGLMYTLISMSFATVALFLFGGTGIAWFFGHGRFETNDVVSTTHCLWAYSLGLIPMALILVLAPAFYAQKNYRIPTVSSIASMSLNIALNSFMILGLGLGSVSVALATSMSAWFNCALLMYFHLRTLSSDVALVNK